MPNLTWPDPNTALQPMLRQGSDKRVFSAMKPYMPMNFVVHETIIDHDHGLS